MKLLTPEKFHERHAELVELRDKADADYRRANLEAAMGTGSDGDVLQAKQALDLLVGQLEGLEAARLESQRIQALESRQARQDAYAKLVENTERLFADREAAIARIEAKALDLGQEIASYAALTSKLRASATAYRPHYLAPQGTPRHVSDAAIKAVYEGIERHTPLLPLVIATIGNDQQVLAGCSLSDREERESAKARSGIRRVAPERELA